MSTSRAFSSSRNGTLALSPEARNHHIVHNVDICDLKGKGISTISLHATRRNGGVNQVEVYGFYEVSWQACLKARSYRTGLRGNYHIQEASIPVLS